MPVETLSDKPRMTGDARTAVALGALAGLCYWAAIGLEEAWYYHVSWWAFLLDVSMLPRLLGLPAFGAALGSLVALMRGARLPRSFCWVYAAAIGWSLPVVLCLSAPTYHEAVLDTASPWNWVVSYCGVPAAMLCGLIFFGRVSGFGSVAAHRAAVGLWVGAVLVALSVAALIAQANWDRTFLQPALVFLVAILGTSGSVGALLGIDKQKRVGMSC
jgi:hypothetical protein